MTIKPTQQLAENVLELVASKYFYEPNDPYGPQLVMDFDWFNDEGWPTIVWEGGPHEWAVECSFALLDNAPKGLWFEATTSWALGIYVN